MSSNIFPTDSILQRSDKEKLLRQRGIVLWMTGLSGSGKTTIAIELERTLNANGKLTQVLDGDNIRNGLNKDLGFSEASRLENIRRIAEVAQLFANCGIITICCFVSPTKEIRDIAKKIIGENDMKEIFIDTPLEICEQRDVKGLYAKARKGEIKDMTGVNSPFDIPENPALVIKAGSMKAEDAVKTIIEKFSLLNK